MPSVRVKKYPKTTAVNTVGSCGHTFNHRFNVPYAFVGKIRNEKNDAELEKEKIFQKGITSRNVCPECAALIGLQSTQNEAAYITKIYNLEAIPDMEGTARMRSYGENLRLTWLSERIQYIQSLTYRTACNPSTGIALAASAIAATYPRTEENPQPSEDILNLFEEVKPLVYRQYRRTPATVSWALATWLTVRYMVKNSEILTTKTKAIDWVKAYKTFYSSNKNLHQSMPDYNIVFAAAIISLMPHWQDRYEAEEAFNALTEESFPDTVKMIENRKGTPLTTVLEEAKVYNTLTGNSTQQTYDYPF